jgi:hypothetical protein
MVIIFYILIALCILHALIQIAIGLTEIVVGVTQIICGLMMMVLIFLRRLIFGKRKPAAHPPHYGSHTAARRPAHARRCVPCLTRPR